MLAFAEEPAKVQTRVPHYVGAVGQVGHLVHLLSGEANGIGINTHDEAASYAVVNLQVASRPQMPSSPSQSPR